MFIPKYPIVVQVVHVVSKITNPVCGVVFMLHSVGRSHSIQSINFPYFPSIKRAFHIVKEQCLNTLQITLNCNEIGPYCLDLHSQSVTLLTTIRHADEDTLSLNPQLHNQLRPDISYQFHNIHFTPFINLQATFNFIGFTSYSESPIMKALIPCLESGHRCQMQFHSLLHSGPKKRYPGFNFAITSINVHRF